MRTLNCGAARVHIGARAFDVLTLLATARGRLVTKDELIRHVWPDTIVEENNLQVHLSAVRKALGARQRDVLLQFLIESATMATLGGAIGVAFGVSVAKLITLIVGFPTAVPLWAILLGLVMAGGVGVFFGVYPASKAAKLDPVVALRAEM